MKDPKAKSKATRAATRAKKVAPNRSAHTIIGDFPTPLASHFRTVELVSSVGVQKVTLRFVPKYDVWVMPEGMMRVVILLASKGWVEARTLVDSELLSGSVPDDDFYKATAVQLRKYLFVFVAMSGQLSLINESVKIDPCLKRLAAELTKADMDSVHTLVFPTRETTEHFARSKNRVKDITARTIANAIQRTRVEKFMGSPEGTLYLGSSSWAWNYQAKPINNTYAADFSCTPHMWVTEITGANRGTELGGFSVEYTHETGGYVVKSAQEALADMSLLVVALVVTARTAYPARYRVSSSAVVVSTIRSGSAANYYYLVVQKNCYCAVSLMRDGHKTPLTTANFKLEWVL